MRNPFRPPFPLIVAVLAVTFACGPAKSPAPAPTDPLPSWADTAPKQRILDFVAAVTDKTGPDFVPAAERIATFDNDGTLWVEKPDYVQFAFLFHEIDRMAPNHPEWKKTQPFKAALKHDFKTIDSLGLQAGITLLLTTHTGMTQAEFARLASDFLTTAKHPRYDRLYTELVYQPMLELLDLLRANDFRVFIVSGGTVELIRGFADEVYGIPPENVIGTSFRYKFEAKPAPGRILREPKIVSFDDRGEKPANIQLHIGRRPILAFGNSDGDIQMMQFAPKSHPHLALLLHHDDADREYDYDHGTEEALKLAPDNNWQVVSIKDDFLRVFPFEGK